MSKRWAVGLSLRAAFVGAVLVAAACSAGGDAEKPSSVQEALNLAVPFRVRAIDFTAFKDSDTLHEGNCGSGPVDQQAVSDNGVTCGVGYTKASEWLEYSLQVASTGKFNFVSRVAGNAVGKTFRLSIDGVTVGGSQVVPSAGWTSFADRTLTDVALTAGSHTLRVLFETGDTNLNYIDVTPGTVTLPQRIEAENYQRAFESTPASNAGTGCSRGDGVDKDPTSDAAGGCLVGWATAGEWLEYDVTVPQAGLFDFTARLAAAVAGRTLQLNVDGMSIGALTAPSSGYTAFEDRKLQNISLSAGPHVVRALFVQGDLNINYLDISVHPIVAGYSFGAAAGYNVFVFQDVAVAPSVAGPVAGGRDISIQGFSYNTSASGSIGALAGRNFTGASGNVQRDLVYGNTLSLNNVTVAQGTSRKATPVNFVAEKAALDLLSANLAKYPTNGTTIISQNGAVFTFTGTDTSRNVFSVSGAALAAADQFNFSVPATSTTIINVAGTAAVFDTSSMQLGTLTPGHLIWNLPQVGTLRISQTGFKGTLLADNAAVTQTNSSLDGVLIAGSATGSNSGITWLPFDGSLTSCSGAALSIAPGSPQLAGTQLALSASATCVDNLAPEFHYDYFNANIDAVWHDISTGFSSAAVTWNTGALPAGSYQLRAIVRRVGEATLSGASATSAFLFDSPTSVPTNAATVQDFNGLGTAAIGGLASGWRIDKQSNPRTLGTFAAATSKTDYRAGALLLAATGNGIYNFGAGVANPQAANYWLNSTDRAPGWLSAGSDSVSGGTKSGNLYFALRAPSNNSLTGLNIGYDVEKYSAGTNPAGFGIQLYSSTDGVNWTSAGTDFFRAFAPDANTVGFDPAPGKVLNVPPTMLSATIPRNALFYLAWNYTLNSPQALDGSSAQAVAVDNVSVRGIACVPNCAGKTCGADLADGCGGLCPAVCDAGQAGCAKNEDCTSADLQCAARSPDPNAHALCVPKTCTATCTAACPCSTAATCTSANECAVGSACQQGACTCTPSCSGKACGAADGCGGVCADGCGPGDSCQPGGCMPGLTCSPVGGSSTGSVCRGPSVTWTDKTRPFQDLPSDGIVPSAPSGQAAAGRLLGSPQVDASGAFTYRIPIEVPPGRAGVEPHLALNYSSANGNGLLGVGWNLEGISSIARCRKTIAREDFADSVKVKRQCLLSTPCDQQVPYYNDTIDNFCLDGERLVHIGGTSTNPEFRTERDSFAKVLATYDGAKWPSKFTVWRRDGTIATYPAGTVKSGVDSRDLVTGEPDPAAVPFSGVLTWPMSISQDRFGNAVTYSYVPGEGGGTVIDTIEYTACAPGSACPYGGATRLVKFKYEPRPNDYVAHWVGGLDAGLSVRLNEIDIWTGKQFDQAFVRSYKIAYDVSGATSRSRLASLTECDGQGTCLNPTVFQWGKRSGQNFRRAWHVIGPAPASTPVAGQCTSTTSPAPGCFYADFTTALIDTSPDFRNPFLIGDFNGDGSDDILTLGGDLTQSLPGHNPEGYVQLSHSENGQVTFEPVRITTGSEGSKRNWRRARVADIDQDGQAEVLIPNDSWRPGDGHADLDTQEYLIYRFSEFLGDFSGPLSLTVPTPSHFAPKNPPSMLDVNGDGILDYFFADSTPLPDNHGLAYYFSKANPSADQLLPVTYQSPTTLHYAPAPADQALYDQGRCQLQAIDYAGHGYSSPAVSCNDANTATYFSDLNGDGLADIVKINRGTQAFASVRLSTGVEIPGENSLNRGELALLPEQQALPALELAAGAFSSLDGFSAHHNRVLDINADGKADIVQFQTATYNEPPAIWLSKAQSSHGSSIEKISLPYTEPRLNGPLQQVGDFNGDGLIDIVQAVELTNDGHFDHAKLQFLIQDPDNRDDLLTHVITTSVEHAVVSYKTAPTAQIGLPGGTIAAPAGLFAPRRGLTVVAGTALVEAGGREVTAYYYENPAADTHGRGFLGFGAIIKGNLARGIKTTTFYEKNTKYLPENNLHGYHAFPYAFLPTMINTATGRDAIADLPGGSTAPIAGIIIETRYEEQKFDHQVHPLNSPGGALGVHTSYFVEEQHSSDTKADVNRSSYYSSSVDRTYDDFGNVTSSSSMVDPEFTDVDTHFAYDTTNWIISQPQWSKTKHWRFGNSGPGYSQSQLPHYVEYGRGPNGEVQSVVNRPGDARTQTFTAFTRDGSGLVRTASSEDRFGNVRAHAYDYSADGVYREHAQDSLGHDTWVGFHSGLGVPLIAYDQNQKLTRYQFDGFGRPRAEIPTLAPLTVMSYAQTAGQLTTTVSQAPGTTVTKHFDLYGRLSTLDTAIGGKNSTIAYGYNVYGQLISKSTPRFGAPPAVPDYKYYYDSIGVLRRIEKPDGGKVTINIDWPLTTETVETSADDKTKTIVVTKTGDGLVESVREKASTGPVLVRGVDYVYGPNRSLFRVAELGGPTTEYYSYGLPKPSYVVSSERGTDSLLYDGFFDLRSSTHGGPYRTSESYQYDALGRRTLSATVAPDPAHPDQALSTETRFIYDIGPGAIGQLSSTVSPDGITTRYGYTPEGSLTHKEYELGADRFSVDYQLDAYGRAYRIDYPETGAPPRFSVNFGYNDAVTVGDGSLSSVSHASVAQWSLPERGPTGLAEKVQLSDGHTQTTIADPATREINRISVAGPGGSYVYDVQYGFYQGGNIKTRSDVLAGTNEQFEYDAFDQLSKWTFSGPASSTTQDYAYDALGNQADAGGKHQIFGGTGYSPHQLAQQITPSATTSYSYDALGRQTKWTTSQGDERTVTYTPFDLPRTITVAHPNPHTVTYAYDANHTRFRQSDETSTTTYVDELYERRVDATGATKHIFYIYAEGRRIAQVVRVGLTETVTRLYSDALGSVNATSQDTLRQNFSPWGERIALSPSAPAAAILDVTTGFTNQEQDDAVGLINMRGRVYDPKTAIFLTPDPIVGRPLNVAGWNKYAYVLSNPLKYIDPSGFDGVESEVSDGNGNWSIVFNDDPLHGPPLSVAPNESFMGDNSFRAAISDADGYIPGAVTIGTGGTGPDLDRTRTQVDSINSLSLWDRLPLHGPGDVALTGGPVYSYTPASQLPLAAGGAEGTAPGVTNFHDSPTYVGTIRSYISMAAVEPPAAGIAIAELESLAAEASAARTFSSGDPLVAELANAIERTYPGHVVGVNVPMTNAAGRVVTDADILLQNAVIQVKSGAGKGLTTQLLNTQAATNLPVIGYGPQLGGSVFRGIQANGGLVTRDAQLLIDIVAP